MTLRALIVGLGLVLALGLAGCGGDDSSSSSTSGTTTEEGTPFSTTDDTTTEAATTGEDEGEAETEGETTTALAAGDATAGREVYLATGCGSCHVLQEAGTDGSVGPNLDERLVADADDAGEPLEDFVRTSIEDPDEHVASGYQAGVMPGTYDDSLSNEQLDNLVAFVTGSVQ